MERTVVTPLRDIAPTFPDLTIEELERQIEEGLKEAENLTELPMV